MDLLLFFRVAFALVLCMICLLIPLSTAQMPSISEKAMHVSAFGFRSDLSMKVLQNVISSSTKIERVDVDDEMQIIEPDTEMPEKMPLVALELDEQVTASFRNDSDVAIVYVHYLSVLNDPPSIVANMDKALKAVLEEGKKRSILICLAVPKKLALSQYQDSVLNVLSEAWTLLPEKDHLTNTSISGKFDIQMLTYVLPEEVTDENFQFEKRTVMDGLLQRLVDPSSGEEREYRTLGELKEASSTKQKVGNRGSQLVQDRKDLGVDVAFGGTEVATEWARQAAQSSLSRLQKAESAKDFATFMENLYEGAIKEMEEFIANSGIAVSVEAKKLATEDLQRDVHEMMYPFFKRFVQLGRQDAAKNFNTAVADELEITIKVMDDLEALKKKAMKNFQMKILSMIPKYAPKKWKDNLEVSQFEQTLNDFLVLREEQAKLQGILPRSRRPIELSVYHFLTQPLGRDHRADPLGYVGGDKVIYDPELASSKTGLTVKPSQARFLAKTPAQKEFAREMLMLPLSIKNPYVPLMGKRSKKINKPPRKDGTWHLTGPERFVDMSRKEVSRVLLGDALESSVGEVVTNTKPENIFDKILNNIPFYGFGYYHHSKYNYGPKYESNTGAPVRKSKGVVTAAASAPKTTTDKRK